MIQSSFKAEQAVIGDILLEPDKVMPVATQTLSPDDFATGEFKTLYKACAELYANNKPIDAVTVIAKAGTEYQSTLVLACQETPTISNYENYIAIVKESSQRRQAWNNTANLLDLLENGKMEECNELVADISECLANKDFSDSFDAKAGFMDFLETRDKPRTYIPTGLSRLDKLVYIDRGDYIVFGGRPSSGKTAFTLQMMMAMARNKKVVYFSLETSKSKVFDRLISNYTRTDFSEIKKGEIKNWEQILSYYDAFTALNFEVVEAAGWTVEQIKAKALQARAEVIFIDYLSLITAAGKSKLEQVTNISIGLHTMAQQHKIAVVALSQLNRGGSKDMDMTSLRESGQIEQDADCILLLQSTDPKDPCADRELIIAKNKEGEVGKMILRFDGQHQRFSEVETRYD